MKKTYGYNKLIIHRDISTGNLLIFEADDGSTFGRLMDYDHAKKASAMGKIESKIAGLSPSELKLQRGQFRAAAEYVLGRQLNDKVLDAVLKWFDRRSAIDYIEDVIKFTGSSDKAPDKPLSLTDLGWIDTVSLSSLDCRPSLSNLPAGPNSTS
ncbi:hypothetical protein C0993_009575 [Termitomyces sp. T159_Od127]|nr:hypothetical protein C0993_009575 [Termitomyces sp. T159_Od127]